MLLLVIDPEQIGVSPKVVYQYLTIGQLRDCSAYAMPFRFVVVRLLRHPEN